VSSCGVVTVVDQVNQISTLPMRSGQEQPLINFRRPMVHSLNPIQAPQITSVTDLGPMQVKMKWVKSIEPVLSVRDWLLHKVTILLQVNILSLPVLSLTLLPVSLPLPVKRAVTVNPKPVLIRALQSKFLNLAFLISQVVSSIRPPLLLPVVP